MVRYHYREGVRFEKKKSRWFLIFVGLVLAVAAAYGAALYIAPQLVTMPLTGLTVEATDNKIKNTKPGELGDRLFIPQVNIDVAIHTGGAADQLKSGVWQRSIDLGDPEKGGNFVLGGYKFTLETTPDRTRAKSPFYNLGKLKEGDDITLDYRGKRYVYRIDRTFDAAASSELEQKSEGYRLTLYATDGQGQAALGKAVSAARISPAVQQETSFGSD